MLNNYLLIIKWNWNNKFKKIKDNEILDLQFLRNKIKKEFIELFPFEVEKLNEKNEDTEVYFLNDVSEYKMLLFFNRFENHYTNFFIKEIYLYKIKKNSPIIKKCNRYKFPDFLKNIVNTIENS